MSCENLLIPKPLTNQCNSTLFGIPYGAAGRTIGSMTYPISGIVLHCYDGTVASLCNEMKCRTRSSVISGTWENSFHYGIGASASSGSIQQFVEDNNISWTFGAYKNNIYTSPPPPDIAINWPVLQSQFGINVTPDVYTIDIALAIGDITPVSALTGCYTCPTSSGLEQVQHDKLVQLLAFLAQEYNIPIDQDHITFHDLIHCGQGAECPCTDIASLLVDVANLCPPCPQEAFVAPEAQQNDVIQFIYGATEPCCPTSPGCLVKIPWDGCYIGGLANDGDLEYILGLAQDPVSGDLCLTKGCVSVVSPLIGCGTISDPLRLDLCAFGCWIPTEDPTAIVSLVGLDDNGCLIDTDALCLIQLLETPITVIDTESIDLTSTGVSGHTLQADLIVSQEPGNQLVVLPDGAYVPPVDVASAICNLPENDQIVPTWILGKDDTLCPVFVTPDQIVAAGFDVTDGSCISLDWTNNVLFATPIISPDVGGISNALSCEPTGLYVPRGADTLVDGPLVGDGSDLNPIDIDFSALDAQDLCDLGSVIPVGVVDNVLGIDDNECVISMPGEDFIATYLLTTDSNCIDLTLNGNVLSASIVIDPINGNQVSCGTNGLFVPRPAVVSVADTGCIDLNIDQNGVLSATPIVDPQVGNQLTCGANGLYVPPPQSITVTDTSCIDLQLNNGDLTAFPIRDNNNPGNQIYCTADGLLVPLGAGIVADDTPCINLSLVPNGNVGSLTATPILAPAQGGVANILQCTSQGLYVPAPQIAGGTVGVADTNCINLTIVNDIITADPIIAPAQGGIINRLQCTSQGLFVGFDNCDLGALVAAQTPIAVTENNFAAIDQNTGCLVRGDRLHNLTATSLPGGNGISQGYTIGSKWIIPPNSLSPDQDRELQYIMVADGVWQRVAGGTQIGANANNINQNIPSGTDFVFDVPNELFDVLGEYNPVTTTYTSLEDTLVQGWLSTQISFPVAPPGGEVLVEMGFIVDDGMNVTVTTPSVVERYRGLVNGSTINLSGLTYAYSVSPGTTLQPYVRHNAGTDAIMSSAVIGIYDLDVYK